MLVAEDNVVNQKVIDRLLGRLGVSPDIVADGTEAVTGVLDRSVAGQPYDVVFMDIQMPTMDGLEATQTIRQAEGTAQPHIIALTANAMEGDRERCLEAGCDGYIPKPVRREDIADALARYRASTGDVDGQPPHEVPDGIDAESATGDDASASGEGSALVQLVYVSAAVRPFSPDELAAILRTSRANNRAVGVTGMLLYSGGNVMQALEGPADAVDDTFRRIQADPRHQTLSLLYRRATQERAFPEWAMGVQSADSLPADEQAHIHELFNLRSTDTDRAHRLLESFQSVAT